MTKLSAPSVLLAVLLAAPLTARAQEPSYAAPGGDSTAAPEGAPPAQPPPPPPSETLPAPAPAPPPQAQPAPAPAPVPPGQWVYTQQYGWIWMPWSDAYTRVPANGYGEPCTYAYYPVYGWTWLAAPWVWGIGPWPVFGVYGPARYAWYAHGWWRYPAHWHYVPAYRGYAAFPFRPGFRAGPWVAPRMVPYRGGYGAFRGASAPHGAFRGAPAPHGAFRGAPAPHGAFRGAPAPHGAGRAGWGGRGSGLVPGVAMGGRGGGHGRSMGHGGPAGRGRG